MKKSFISLLRKALFIPPLVIILFSVIGWSILEYFSWHHEFVEETSKLIEERKNFILERSRIAASYIDFQRSSSLGRKKVLMEAKISDTYDFIDSLYGTYDGASKEDVEKKIFNTLDDMAFGEAGGFIMKETGDLVFYPGESSPSLFPNHNSIPTDYLIENLDKNMDGRFLVSYVFEKKEDAQDKPKRIFCLKRFRQSGWVIGISASYEEVEKEARATISGWFSRLESIGSQGFIFIMDSEGQIISNSGLQNVVGKNIKEVAPGNVSEAIFNKLGKKSEEFADIEWISGAAENARISRVSFFNVPEWGWTVGVGFFTDDLDKALEYKKAQGRQEIFVAIRFLIIVLPLFLIIGFFFYRIISMRLEKNFLNFHSFFKNAQEKGARIDSSEMDFGEFVSMADAANKMLEERQSTESRLRQSESNFASFFNSIEDSIFVVNDDLKILAMNPSAIGILDISNKNDSPNNLSDFYDADTISRIQCFVLNHEKYSRDMGQGFLSHADSLKKNVQTSAFEGTWNSEKAFFILSRDISFIVASEEKFSKIFSESPVMMSVSTADEGRFVDINKTATEYLGYPREAFIGSLSTEVGIFADPSWRNKMKPFMKKYGNIRNEEVDLVTKSGEILHCILSMDIISFAGQKYILTVGNNITERKKAEKSLVAAKEEALASKARLEETLRELELFNRFMMDREERLMSLKEEVNQLLQEAGKTPRYNISDYIGA
ncbi:cache domain-containing protein [Desulforegula conservatrix]|uniref:cache domain-containing protein n=1 Tax=Desulforegula conservatrix TaxID=153026 RepID=UPI00041558B4|nr:cache domain-containing protein [Desulforegula conservatrix]